MKLSNLLLFAGSAVGSYLLVKNREVITEEVLDTTDRVEAIKGDLDVIQNSLQIINQQKEVIKEYQSLRERPPSKTCCDKRTSRN